MVEAAGVTSIILKTSGILKPLVLLYTLDTAVMEIGSVYGTANTVVAGCR